MSDDEPVEGTEPATAPADTAPTQAAAPSRVTGSAPALAVDATLGVGSTDLPSALRSAPAAAPACASAPESASALAPPSVCTLASAGPPSRAPRNHSHQP